MVPLSTVPRGTLTASKRDTLYICSSSILEHSPQVNTVKLFLKLQLFQSEYLVIYYVFNNFPELFRRLDIESLSNRR